MHINKSKVKILLCFLIVSHLTINNVGSFVGICSDRLIAGDLIQLILLSLSLVVAKRRHKHNKCFRFQMRVLAQCQP